MGKQDKASTIIASGNSTFHKQAILLRFRECLMHVLNRFYQAVFSTPAKMDWEWGYSMTRIHDRKAVNSYT